MYFKKIIRQIVSFLISQRHPSDILELKSVNFNFMKGTYSSKCQVTVVFFCGSIQFIQVEWECFLLNLVEPSLLNRFIDLKIGGSDFCQNYPFNYYYSPLSIISLQMNEKKYAYLNINRWRCQQRCRCGDFPNHFAQPIQPIWPNTELLQYFGSLQCHQFLELAVDPLAFLGSRNWIEYHKSN